MTINWKADEISKVNNSFFLRGTIFSFSYSLLNRHKIQFTEFFIN